MGSSGSLEVVATDFVLTVSGLPPFQPGILYYGDVPISFPSGNGTRCVGGQTVRLPPVVAGAAGTVSVPLSWPTTSVTPYSTWYFQFWYRDPASSPPMPATFSFSDGLALSFCP